jgi:hypothetical protein
VGKENIEKKIGPVKGSGVWRIRTNQELLGLYREPGIISEIRRVRYRWLGHVERMSKNRMAKKVFKYATRKKVPWKANIQMV